MSPSEAIFQWEVGALSGIIRAKQRREDINFAGRYYKEKGCLKQLTPQPSALCSRMWVRSQKPQPGVRAASVKLQGNPIKVANLKFAHPHAMSMYTAK